MNIYQYPILSSIVGSRTTLLNNEGYTNINQAKIDFPGKSNLEIYDILLKKYNKEAKKENERIVKEYYVKKAIMDLQKIENRVVETYSVSKRKELERKKKQIEKRKKNYNKLVTKITFNEQTEPYGKFVALLKNKFVDKSIIIDLVVDKQVIKTFNMTPSLPFKNWWEQIGKNEFEYPENLFLNFPNGVLYIYEGKHNLNKQKIIQHFKEGEVNCLLKGIINWATNRLELAKGRTAKFSYKKMLKNLNNLSTEIGDKGVDEQLISKICNEIQIDISIEYAIPLNDQYLLEIKSSKKPLKKFKFRNTKIDHVDEITCLNNIEFVDKDRLYEIKEQLDINKTFYNFNSGNDGYTSISTIEKTFMISNDFYTMTNQFEIVSGLENCYIDDIADKNLSQFIKNGTHYNSTVDFKKHSLFDNIHHIDMMKAYVQYKKSIYYQGFLGEITCFRKTNKVEGVGLYQIHNINLSPIIQLWNDKLKIFHEHNVYTSAELKFLDFHNCTYEVSYGCWGVSPLDFDMLNFEGMCDGYDKTKDNQKGISGYAKFVGKCDSHHLNKKLWCKGNEELSKTIPNSVYYKNDTISVSIPKQHNNHIGHFTAFILAYTRLNMLEQLISMDYEQIVRICVDGIYFIGECDYNKEIFNYKKKQTFANVAGLEYISNIIDTKIEWDCGEYRHTYKTELHLGEGGTGKTHINLCDKGFIKIGYFCPSWKLATNKKNEYKCESNVWFNLLSDDPTKIKDVKRNCNVLIIDEVSMMTNPNKEKLIKTYPNKILIFCGDIGYQAGPILYLNSKDEIEEEIKPVGFDYVKEYTINYRVTCPQLKELLTKVRGFILNKFASKTVTDYVVAYLKNRIIDNYELRTLYDINDMILSKTHKVKDEYTNMFFEMNKWYVLNNTRHFKKGDIIIGEKPPTNCEIRHCYTVHSIQGETANKKLFINIDSSYEPRLLYTALSRARNISQIYIINNITYDDLEFDY